MTNKEYSKTVKQASPGSKVIKNCLNAFWVGGLICLIGQIFINMYQSSGLEKRDAATAASMTLIALAILATGLNVFEKAAKIGKAGTLVPITGFANSMASPAIEFKTEGHVTGIGAKMFTIAGPVLLYGITASFVYGLVLILFKLF